jgi:hypothetical protein
MYIDTDEAMLRALCDEARSFGELVGFATIELSKFPEKAEIVCGPITTGGQGSVEKNLKVFNGAIKGLIAQGRPVFNQMPYETALFRLRAEYERLAERNPDDKTYNPVVLEEFYRPLFQTRQFLRAWFLPGWRSSQGACWERGVLLALGADVTDLSEDHLANLLALA